MPKKTMRSPRRLNLSHPAVQQIQVRENPPEEDSLSWRLWLSFQDIAGEALQSDYIQGIAKGNLSPDEYGQYTIQDAVYCYHAQEDYKTLERRARAEGEADLAAFLEARYDGYISYNKSTFQSWHIKDPNALEPGEAARHYIETEHRLSTAPPIYGLVGMIPCEQLWPWLATQIQSGAVSTNVYSPWITGNQDWGGAYRLDNFLNAWAAEHPGEFEEAKASQVYRLCMTCEVNFFRSATGQTLLPWPALPEF